MILGPWTYNGSAWTAPILSYSHEEFLEGHVPHPWPVDGRQVKPRVRVKMGKEAAQSALKD